MPTYNLRPLRFVLPTRIRRSLPPGSYADYLVSILDSVRELRRWPKLRNPSLFNDHLLRLRADGSLYDPLRQFVTDKEYVKHYITATVGREYIIPTISIYRTAAEVQHMELSHLPCVIKPTHMSGPIHICVDAHTRPDKTMMTSWLNDNYYRASREANYRYLQRKIIVEEFFSVDGRLPPNDYKIFCFHGQPKLIEVDAGRFDRHTRNFYDVSWNRLPFAIKYPARPQTDPKPRHLSRMLEIASVLSRPFPSIRVDLYAHSGKIKVGELTNCHGGGTEFVNPSTAESWLGSLFNRHLPPLANSFDWHVAT